VTEIIAKVAVENTAYSFDEAFDYAIPDFLLSEVKPGKRVVVPFGRGNTKRQGFVFALRENKSSVELKSISAVLDSAPLLNNEMLRLAVYLKDQTFCTLYEAAKAMLPSGFGLKFVNSYLLNPDFIYDDELCLTDDEREVLEYLKNKDYVYENKIIKDLGFDKNAAVVRGLCSKGYIVSNAFTVERIGNASVKMARLTQFYYEASALPKFSAKQKSVIKLLEDIGSASVKEICYFTGVTYAVVVTLQKKGIIEVFENETYRKPKALKGLHRSNPLVLSDEQERAYLDLSEKYRAGKAHTSLLFGVTGSGKTTVFLKLIDDVIKDGKSVIVMVPEISLTPQLLSVFYERYGDEVAVFHSGLSMGERKDEWKRVYDKKAKIAVGTRSAVFAPVENVGLIIIDEEQEASYKSEMTPRYNAKDVAKFRAKYNNSLLVLASATPSVIDYAAAKSGSISLNVLSERYGNAVLPEVITTEMKYAADVKVRKNLSQVLENEIAQALSEKHQSILLLNRRGFNTFASCGACGKVKVCPHCSISLTYHSKNRRLMCHYCGYSEPFTDTCSYCGEKAVMYSGFGTQKLEDELREKFPDARILRLDTDSTSSRYFFENSLKDFADGKYDILVGTQMVAKGLDFPNVTLVGVVSIDQQLFNDDYKSAERAFDLLTQVVGRAGRGNIKGKAVIQTSFPENEIIRLAAKQDYESFFNMEIRIRKALIYPPYCDFCAVSFIGKDEALTKQAAQSFFESVKYLHGYGYPDLGIILLSPIAPRIEKVADKYRNRVIIKCKNSARFRAFISTLLKNYMNDKKFKDITVFADINPENMF